MSSVPHEFPVYPRPDIEIVSGAGCHVQDAKGKRYLDLYGGHAVAALGYGHPGLVRALDEQARSLIFQTNALHVKTRDDVHRRLVEFAPQGLDRVLLVNSGAEANENALRLAFRGTQRSKVVSLQKGWHGRTAAAGAVTSGSEAWYAFPRTPFDTVAVPEDDVAALDAALDDDVACLILEPVQGIAGARDLDLDFLRAARRLTQERGILLLSDEIQCGMGRTGFPFAIEAAEVVPDLLTTAKALGGGFPAAALFAREDLAADLPAGAFGTTFGGGPLAAAAIHAVLDVLTAPGFLDGVRRLGDRIRATCCVGPIESIQGRGLLAGLRTRGPAKEVVVALRERGILTGGSSDPQVLRLMPPLILEEQHVDLLATALSEIGP